MTNGAEFHSKLPDHILGQDPRKARGSGGARRGEARKKGLSDTLVLNGFSGVKGMLASLGQK